MNEPVPVFVSYAHADEAYKDTFRKHVISLTRRNTIALWDDRALEPGVLWLDEIRDRVETCAIAVLLVSQDFLASEFIEAEEFSKLMSRHRRGEVQIFPVILKPCGWKNNDLRHLQVLPKDGRAITSFSVEDGARDQTWVDISDAFSAVVAGLHDPADASDQQDAQEPARVPPARQRPSTRQISGIVRALNIGRLSIFLGEGLNRLARPDDAEWSAGSNRITPLGTELARHFAEFNDLQVPETATLPSVAQLVAVHQQGTGPVFDDLHDAFDNDFPIPNTHRALARLPQILRQSNPDSGGPILLSMNYDDIVERAFEEAGEPLDVLAFRAVDKGAGAFQHIRRDGSSRLIQRPNEYTELDLDSSTLLIKLAGTVGRTSQEVEHFVVTEDDYFTYAAGQDVHELLPAKLITSLRRSHYLFLGHSLSQWTRRVVISRIFGDGRMPARSWVVNDAFALHDRDFWDLRDVEPIEVPLEDFVAELLDTFEATQKNTRGAA